MGVLAATEAELPTSTTRAPSEPTTSATDNPSHNVVNNPSLILAFLALSFFTLAMVFVFGFRRYQQMQHWNRGLVQHGWGERQAEEEIQRMAENKPQVWEVLLDTRWRETKAGGTEGKELGWESLMPLSASSLKNVNRIGIAADPVSLSPPTAAPHSHSMIMSSMFQHIGGLRAFRALSPRTEDDNPLKRETIQVVFPVAMPSKYRPIHVTEM